MMEQFIYSDHRATSAVHSGRDDILYNENLFAIHAPFAVGDNERTSGRKRRAASDAETTVAFPEWPPDHDLHEGLTTFIEANAERFPKSTLNEENYSNENRRAKDAAAQIPSGYFFQGCARQTFHNDIDTNRIFAFQNRRFILPPHSFGILGTLNPNSTTDILQAARTLYGSDGPFDVILVDPPWINKSVKRQRRYMTTDSEDCLSQLPIERLLHPDGVLLAWYTHNSSHYAQLKSQMEKWNLQLAATWTWLKVTTDGRPICPFGRNFKKPYEHLLLATRNSTLFEALHKSDRTVAVSVPSAVHSHKPNLEEILERFDFNCNTKRCLELFARTMKSNWVSFGNEVLKLQCVEMFDAEKLLE